MFPQRAGALGTQRSFPRLGLGSSLSCLTRRLFPLSWHMSSAWCVASHGSFPPEWLHVTRFAQKLLGLSDLGRRGPGKGDLWCPNSLPPEAPRPPRAQPGHAGHGDALWQKALGAAHPAGSRKPSAIPSWCCSEMSQGVLQPHPPPHMGWAGPG